MKKLYIFSYGLYPGQVTLETLLAMRECGEVYSHCLDAASARQFRRYAPRLRLTGRLGLERTAAAVAAALGKHDTVGFLTYGNPLFLNQTAPLLAAAAARRRAEVRVFAAVSSFDALVNLFGLNPFSPAGLRLLDAGTWSAAQRLHPEMDTLVFVPDRLRGPGAAGRLEAFIEAARAAYPGAAPAFLADCYASENSRHRTVAGTAGGLRALLARAGERTTLFIPAVRAPEKKRPAGAAGRGKSRARGRG